MEDFEMEENDLASMIKKAQEMINNNQIPDELKGLINNMNSNNKSNNLKMNSNSFNKTSSIHTEPNKNTNFSSQGNSNYNSINYNKYANTYSRNNYSNNTSATYNQNAQSNMNVNHSEKNNNENQDFPNLDIETMLKLQNIMSKLKSSNSEDDMSKLLLSLKPYLRNEKKEKVDEYIKLIKMGKMTQLFNSLGGDK